MIMSPDTELPGAPRALMPSDGSGRGMRLPDFIMRLAPALLLALAAAGSAGCRDSAKKTPDLYEDSEFAAVIRMPPGWVQMESLSMLAKRQFECPGTEATMFYDANRDPCRCLLDMDTEVDNFQSSARLVYPGFVLLDRAPTNLFGCPAVRFSGDTAKMAVLGLVVKNETDSYRFLFVFPAALTNGPDLFDGFIKGVSISPLPDARQAGESFVRRLPVLATSNDVANAIRYGNELLMGRDSNVNYYNGAMQQYAAALAATYRRDPRPAEYDAALAQMQLCFFFREETFYRQRRRLEQALGLGNKPDAFDAADCIMRLFPDRNSWQFKYGARKWDEAERMRFNP